MTVALRAWAYDYTRMDASALEVANKRFVERVQMLIDADPDASVASVAEKAGMREGALRHILSRRTRSPKLETAMAICEALGTNLFVVMGFPPDPQVQKLLKHFSTLPDAGRIALLTGLDASNQTASPPSDRGDQAPGDKEPTE